MEILKIENLSYTYPGASSPAITGIDLTVNEGEFITLLGPTGSGKSTLLRLIKPEMLHNGKTNGKILLGGKNVYDISASESARRIGYVMQDPELCAVTDKVWHELAFGLESLGAPSEIIRRRVAETACYFGIEEWFDKRVSELSGGQKQLLNLASVMVMEPDILILDEPTASLDPITSAEFFRTLKQLNRDLSLTVIISEHRLENLMQISDRLILLDGGKLRGVGSSREIVSKFGADPDILAMMPAAARLYHKLRCGGECPLTLTEGKEYIRNNFKNEINMPKKEEYRHNPSPALEFKGVYQRYKGGTSDALDGLDLTVYENEVFCILGANGSGKSTALRCAAGTLLPYSGRIKVFGKDVKKYKDRSLYRNCLSLLPQNPRDVFLYSTVREELAEVDKSAVSLPFDISHLYEKHPYDISGGEMQLVALGKVLATQPRLILMDEPTKGLDPKKKLEMVKIIKDLKAGGVTVVIVTHDTELAALCADRCALFFRGSAVSVDVCDSFFSSNAFYTTEAVKLGKGYYVGTVTLDALADLCKKNGRREAVL